MECLDSHTIGLKFDNSELARLILRNADGGNSYRCTVLLVKIKHLIWIHSIHVICTKYEYILWIFIVNQIKILQNGICAAGVPTRSEALLRRNCGDVVISERRHSPGSGDVLVERMRFVLGEHRDFAHIAIDEIREHKINQPIRAAKGNGGFCAIMCQGQQPLPLAASQYDRNQFVSTTHGKTVS